MSASAQTTTQVLVLRPQPQGDLVGEMDVTVQSNECGQRAAVVRIPAVAVPQRRHPAGGVRAGPGNVSDPDAEPPTTTATQNRRHRQDRVWPGRLTRFAQKRLRALAIYVSFECKPIDLEEL